MNTEQFPTPERVMEYLGQRAHGMVARGQPNHVVENLQNAKQIELTFDDEPVGTLYDFLTNPANVEALDEDELLYVASLLPGQVAFLGIGGGFTNVTRIN